jgi:hypothetical protein
VYVYKIIFPNGKIYVGCDYGRNAAFNIATYFGSFKSSAEAIIREHKEHFENKRFTITKEILYDAENQTKAHIMSKESEFIQALKATNPKVGYNKKR